MAQSAEADTMDPVATRRRPGLRYLLAAAGCAVLAAGYWRGCVSEFRQALPLTARQVQTVRLRVSRESAFYGRARISAVDFRTLASRLGLKPYRVGMPYSRHYFIPSHSDPDNAVDMIPAPPWFVPPQDIGAGWCFYRACDYRAACYHDGTVYYVQTSSLFEDP